MTAQGRAAHWLAKHGSELARHIRRLVRDDEMAADLLQETMLRAHRAAERLRADANERAWLYRIATNLSLNHLRSQARERRALERHAREADAAPRPATDGRDEADRRLALWTRVASLPERQRLALTLRIADELAYDEIARRLGCTVAAARANVYQATRKLRREVR
ncbi:MAG: sigma-70 family RNA polymerase sigma factor [Gemmatimonadetes bacterium]|nr:sigma-70 family RNA polymerase sigma factor [Gemmatimonadota bacterium]